MFTFPKNVDLIPATHKFYDYSGVNRKFIKLNSNDADRKIGTAKVLKVMSGDVVEMGVMSYYPVNSASNNTLSEPADLIVHQLVNLLLGPASVIPNGKNNILQSNSNGLILNKEDFNAFVTNNQGNNPTSTVPKAYLNYVLFDDNFKMVSGGVVRVSQPDVITPLASNVSVNKNGYLYVYVSNESPTDVYFDDLVVKHTTGHLLQEDSYYPFGLQIRALSSNALNRMQNDYLYNGIEKVSDFDLEVYDALYRNLDAQIGRWWQVDPLAENFSGISPYNSNFNNPIRFSYPFGDSPTGDDDLWWMDLLNKKKTFFLKPVEIVAKRGGGELAMRFVTEDFSRIALRVLKARSVRNSRSGQDNLIPKDLKPLPPAMPKQEPISISVAKPTSVGPTDPCFGCREIARQEAWEREVNRRMFETEQGGSFLIVKSAVDAAAGEFVAHKVAQGTVAIMGMIGGQGGRGGLTVFEVANLRISQTLETNAEMKALGKLKVSIEKTGFNYDIPYVDQVHVFQYDGVNYLVNGHHRLAVAQKLGITEMRGMVIDEAYLMGRYGVTPEQLIKISERANAIGNKIRWYK